MHTTCAHLRDTHRVKPLGTGCKECLELGDTWVELRLCLTCGHIGCCDNSKNRHATRHFERTGHPVIESLEPGETWRWCYIDRVYAN